MDLKRMLKKSIPAPLWKRILAYLVDIGIVSFVILAPLKGILEKFSKGDDLSQLYQFLYNNPQYALNIMIIFLTISLLTILYWSILEFNIGQSVGKIIFNLYVVSNKKKLNFSQCFFRNISKFSSFLLLLDVIYMLFKGGNQRYLEVVSGTEVIVGGNNGKI